MKKTLFFDTFMYVDGKLYSEIDAEIDETISDEMDLALTELGMYTEWLEVGEGDTVKITNSNGDFSFTKDELIKIALAFGHEKLEGK